jgi:hypothetical protein
MAKFDFTDPSGKSYSVEGPDGATPEQAFQILQGHLGGQGAGAVAAPDIGDSRASMVSGLRGVPIAGALADKGTAVLNAAAQPFTETGLSHAPTFAGRVAENTPRIKAGTDAYEASHPVGSTVGKMAIGTASMAPLAAWAPLAKALGMSGTLPQMAGYGAVSGAGIGAADAAARGENPVQGAVEGGVAGGALPVIGRGVAGAVKGVRNLVSSAPRVPHTVDLAGSQVQVPESYGVNGPRDPAAAAEEQLATAGSRGDEAQKVAQAANQDTMGQTRQAAQQFGDQMRGGPGPAQPAATPQVAGGQTITELAQQHNDQVSAQARHDAQIAAEGTALRSNIPLGAPEPAHTPTVGEAIAGLQGGMQQRAATARQNVTNLYHTAGQTPGDYTPGAWDPVGQSVRNQIERGAAAQGVRPVTVNQGLTPHSQAMMDVVDNRLGMNYAPNALQRGDMIRTPDGRTIPRPLTPADVEAARQEMVGHLQDARSAARAPGGSGTDAYAAQQIMNAFDAHHRAILRTPGAFSGDGPAYLAAIDAARAAHSQRRATFSNQGNGDTIGPVIERMIGRHPGQEMPVGQMATSLYGPASNPGSGNSAAIAGRALNIVGPQSPEATALRQGLLSHLTENPEGMAPPSATQQADRLHRYVQTPHAATLFTPEQRTRMIAHANDLRAQAQPAAGPATDTARAVAKLSGPDAVPSDFVQKIMPKTGEVPPGSEKLIAELRNRVSQPTFNSLRQAMWSHLLERPEGVTEFGPQALSQRLSRFLASPAAATLYSDAERGVMRQFADHFGKLAPMPNTVNTSNSATVGERLARGSLNRVGGMLGMMLGHSVLGHLGGYFAGKSIQGGVDKMQVARQVAKTKDLFLGKKPSHALNPNYARAAAVISHAATPLIGQDGA